MTHSKQCLNCLSLITVPSIVQCNQLLHLVQDYPLCLHILILPSCSLHNYNMATLDWCENATKLGQYYGSPS
jgi:hypothetical protein